LFNLYGVPIQRVHVGWFKGKWSVDDIITCQQTRQLIYRFFFRWEIFLQDHYLSDVLLQEIVDRMGKDLAEAEYDAETMNDMPAQLALMTRASKDMENERMDYDAIMEGDPNPSLRDTEFLQHSTLWGNQYVSGGAGEGPHRVKPAVKTDASLPAYCNPPNPCPVGYTEEQGCTLDFENTGE
jgi:Neuroendocrine protein 7B2 precursor (Secretogranin V)